MRSIITTLLTVLALLAACVTKRLCVNGSESFRPVLDPENDCKVRIRQVVIGSEIKTPDSIAINGSAVGWVYDWSPSEFKDGHIELGHLILKPELPAPALEKK